MGFFHSLLPTLSYKKGVYINYSHRKTQLDRVTSKVNIVTYQLVNFIEIMIWHNKKDIERFGLMYITELLHYILYHNPAGTLVTNNPITVHRSWQRMGKTALLYLLSLWIWPKLLKRHKLPILTHSHYPAMWISSARHNNKLIQMWEDEFSVPGFHDIKFLCITR